MNVVIYNINSFGGNYEYAKYIFNAYLKNSNVDSCILLMPENAKVEQKSIYKILYSDIPSVSNKLFKKIHFLYRSLVNPLRFFFFLKKQLPSTVIFNDFDQITAWFWAPFYSLLKHKHQFSVILHDPDRDNFFRFKFLSESSMGLIMSFMDVAFYHGFLPDRRYYQKSLKKIKVPHGIYDDTKVDETVYDTLIKQKGDSNLVGVLGNIRDEKNYKIIIDALPLINKVKLLIAGKAANSGVSVEEYRQYAKEKQVDNKIIWMVDYLSQGAFNAAITACDIVLLHYKPSFTSQSGVLNTIAPFKKKLIISDVESSLKASVEKYCLGKIVPHDSSILLAQNIVSLLSYPKHYADGCWENYIKDSSWDKHVEIALTGFK